jgi:hypothetical protein
MSGMGQEYKYSVNVFKKIYYNYYYLTLKHFQPKWKSESVNMSFLLIHIHVSETNVFSS